MGKSKVKVRNTSECIFFQNDLEKFKNSIELFFCSSTSLLQHKKLADKINFTCLHKDILRKSLDEEFIIRTVSRCGDYDVSVKNAYIITHGGKTVDDVITEELLYKQTIDCNTGN